MEFLLGLKELQFIKHLDSVSAYLSVTDYYPILSYFKNPIRQTQALSSPNIPSGLYHCLGSSSPGMAYCQSQFRSYSSFKVQLKSYQPHTPFYQEAARGYALPNK